MAWDDAFAGTETVGETQAVELVGAHLRLTGTIQLGRFGRLTDFVNASRGFIRIHDVQLLLPDGKPTALEMPEVMVDQDEIAIIAQREAREPEPGVAVGFLEPRYEASGALRQPREFVLFTQGHSVRGKVHVFGQTDVAGFVDATDPHFIPVTEARMRRLDDDRITSTFQFLLMNRKQMIAAFEVPRTDEGTPDDGRPDDGTAEEAAEPVGS